MPKPAYALTKELFASVKDEYVLVVLDGSTEPRPERDEGLAEVFSNLEKPYGYHLEDLCTLKAKGRRPGPRLRKGLVPGYNRWWAWLWPGIQSG